MAKPGYDVTDLKHLSTRPTQSRDSMRLQPVLILGLEIRDYLRRSISRSAASPEKMVMGLAILDVWSLLDRSLNGPNGRAADLDVVAAVATVAATTAQTGSENDDEREIVTSARQSLRSSLVGDAWAGVWSAATGIGTAIGFALDVDATRAERVWAALITFAGSAVKELAGPVPSEAVEALRNVEQRVRATERGSVEAISESRSNNATGDHAVEPHLLTPDWDELHSAPADDGARRVRVWFGTNREPVAPHNPNSGFTNRLAEGEMSYGVCQVNLPKVEQATGGATAFISAWLRVGADRGPARIERLYRFAGLDAFLDALNSELRQTPAERGAGALVFVHGYATSFSDAVAASARIGAAIKHSGPMATFSWASKGRRSAYRHDEQIVERSRAQLIEFLQNLVDRARVDHVDIIVHSLGNRLFLRSLIDWLRDDPRPTPPLRNIFLGAPDVDQSEFLASSSLFASAGAKTTLYASSTDSALLASQAIHRGAPRAGLMPPVATTAEIDTIETSRIDFSRIRHAYLLDAPAVRADLFNVQAGAVDPVARPNVYAAGSEMIPDYWRMM